MRKKKIGLFLAGILLSTNLAYAADTPTPTAIPPGTEGSGMIGEINIADYQDVSQENENMGLPDTGELDTGNLSAEDAEIAGKYNNIFGDVQMSDYAKSFSESFASTFDMDLVTSNIKEIGSADLITDAKLDMGSLNMQYDSVSLLLSEDFTAGVQESKASNSMQLWEDTYGGMVDKSLKVIDIPESFNPNAMMASAKSSIASTYSDRLNSGTFAYVRGNINVSGIFEEAAKGVQVPSVLSSQDLYSKMDHFGQKAIAGEYSASVAAVDGKYDKIDIYSDVTERMLENESYKNSAVYAMQKYGIGSDEFYSAVAGDVDDINSLFTKDPTEMDAARMQAAKTEICEWADAEALRKNRETLDALSQQHVTVDGNWAMNNYRSNYEDALKEAAIHFEDKYGDLYDKGTYENIKGGNVFGLSDEDLAKITSTYSNIKDLTGPIAGDNNKAFDTYSKEKQEELKATPTPNPEHEEKYNDADTFTDSGSDDLGEDASYLDFVYEEVWDIYEGWGFKLD